MQLATRSDLRAKLYRAYVTRASTRPRAMAIEVRQHGADRRNPGPCAGRSPIAGHANFGEASVVPKMAQSPPKSSSSCATSPAAPVPMREKDVADLRALPQNI